MLLVWTVRIIKSEIILGSLLNWNAFGIEEIVVLLLINWFFLFNYNRDESYNVQYSLTLAFSNWVNACLSVSLLKTSLSSSNDKSDDGWLKLESADPCVVRRYEDEIAMKKSRKDSPNSFSSSTQFFNLVITWIW